MSSPKIIKLNVPKIHTWVYDVRNNRGGWRDHATYPIMEHACKRWREATTPEAKAVEEEIIRAELEKFDDLPAEFKPKAQ
jgi:hypothetical protein